MSINAVHFKFYTTFEVAVRACWEAYFVAHACKYFSPFFASGETCMMLLFGISIQLSVELLISHAQTF